jgi:hypothetical protein
VAELRRALAAGGKAAVTGFTSCAPWATGAPDGDRPGLIYALGYGASAWIVGRSILREPTAWILAFLVGWGHCGWWPWSPSSVAWSGSPRWCSVLARWWWPSGGPGPPAAPPQQPPDWSSLRHQPTRRRQTSPVRMNDQPQMTAAVGSWATCSTTPPPTPPGRTDRGVGGSGGGPCAAGRPGRRPRDPTRPAQACLPAVPAPGPADQPPRRRSWAWAVHRQAADQRQPRPAPGQRPSRPP